MTQAEERRYREFENISNKLIEDGYRRTDLRIGIVAANIFAVVLLIVYGIVTLIAFTRINSDWDINFNGMFYVIFIVAILALTVVHELIHGITWAIFSENHWQDIEFGFQAKTLTPYCTCKRPLKKGQYVLGALMPMILLGIVPSVISFFTGSFMLLILGAVMFSSAAGDIMIVWKFLTHKVEGNDAVYMDHPTEPGSVVFER